MFQFTREFIINDADGKLKVKNLTNYESDANGTLKSKFAVAKNGEVLYIDNMTNIRKKDINGVWKTSYQNPENEELRLALPTIPSGTLAVGDVVRLVIGLCQDGRIIATFNDSNLEHTRSYFYEAVVEKADTIPVDGLMKAIKAENAMTNDRYADFTLDGTTNELTITALDEYTIAKSVRLVKVGADKTSNIGAVLTGYEDYQPLLTYDRSMRDANGAPVAHSMSSVVNITVVKSGTVSANGVRFASRGAGTTNYILQNMRLQSDANINPYGWNIDERPLPKGKYDQYLVELVTENRHIAGGTTGSINHSLTSLVFYVLSSNGTACDVNVSDTFETLLKKVAGEDCFYELSQDLKDKETEGSPEAYEANDEPVIETGNSKRKKAASAE